MASELLSSVTGGGSGFTAKTATGGILVSSGATGTLFTLTPPAGEKVRLTQLISTATMTSLTTVTIGGSAVVTAKKLVASTVSFLTVSDNWGISGEMSNNVIFGDVDEAVVVTTDIATSHNIYYSYEFGA